MGWSWSPSATPSMVPEAGSVGLRGGDEAGVDEQAVEQDGAGTALAFAAALFGAGESELRAEDVEQAGHGWGLDGVGFGR